MLMKKMKKNMPSNRHLRLDPDEWPSLIKEPGFEEFYYQVTDFFYCMKPGQAVRLESEKNLRWLVKAACAFISEGSNWELYYVNDDFNVLYRSSWQGPTFYEKEVERRFREEHPNK